MNKEVCWGVGGGQGSCGKRYGGCGKRCREMRWGVGSAYERGVQRVHRTRARVLGGPGMFKKRRVSQQHKHVKVPQIIKKKELRALRTKNKFFQLRISNLDPYW